MTFTSMHSMLVLCLVSLNSTLPATENNTPQASLPLHTPDAVVRKAIDANPDLMAAMWTIERAAGRIDQAGRFANPELQTSVLTDRPFGNEGEQAWSISISQSFPLTNRLRKERAVAQAELEAAQAEVAAARRSVAIEAVHSWREATGAHARILLIQEQQQLYFEMTRFVRAAAERGERSSLEADTIDLEYHATSIRLREATNELAQHLNQLRLLLGLEPGQPIDLPPVSALPQQELSSTFHPNSADIDSLPALIHAKALHTTAEASLSLARTSRWDDITVSLAFEEERGFDAPLGLKRDQFMGLSVSIPLPFRDRSQGLTRERMAARHQAEAQWNSERYKARHRAITTAEEATRLLQTARDTEASLLTPASQLAARTEAAWQAGEIPLTDVLRAREQLLTIREKHLHTTILYLQAADRHKAAINQPPFNSQP